MKYFVLLIVLFSLFNFSFSVSAGEDKKTEMDFAEGTHIMFAGDSFVIVQIIIELAGVLDSAWLQINGQKYCQKEFERVGSTVTFTCRIDYLEPDTDYELAVVAKDVHGEELQKLLPFRTKAKDPPIALPKRKNKDK
jgi:hypothetical protein